MQDQRQERTDLNLLFIIADQFRVDLLCGGLAACVPTPNLDRLSRRSLRLTNHHTVAVPCGPARASLFTGLHPSEHRATRNGLPLKSGLTNMAQQLRRLGREPLLFGYTDTQPDPALLFRRDPAKLSYTGPMDGFTEVVEMREEAWRWLSHLRSNGYDVPDAGDPQFANLYRPQGGVFGGPALYDARHSDTAFLTDETIKALDVRKQHPWSAFVTYIRPHPPYVAPAPFHDLIDPQSLPTPLTTECTHPFLEVERTAPSNKGMFWGYDGHAGSLDASTIAKVRATYLGLVAELDENIGRLFDWLDDTDQSDRTAIVFTADHGDMLGDYGLWGKLSPFPQASHVPFLICGPDIETTELDHVTQSSQVMGETLRYFEGGDVTFDRVEGDQMARVEFSLIRSKTPTRFQKAWGPEYDTPLCTVHHDRQSRTASFGGGIPDLCMSPEDGQPG